MNFLESFITNRPYLFLIAAISAVVIILAATGAVFADDGDTDGGDNSCEAYIQGEAECSRVKYGNGYEVFENEPYDPEAHAERVAERFVGKF